ncbi:MAG: hypothetical protein KDC93_11150, partial [Cyclobacteriaceae bacterium]|nr:hypothetical protein [Cyclobacteriaceae bacterium]
INETNQFDVLCACCSISNFSKPSLVFFTNEQGERGYLIIPIHKLKGIIECDLLGILQFGEERQHGI